MKNKKIYYWSSNNSIKSGEGVLANNFLYDLEKKLKIKCIKIKKNTFFDKVNKDSFIYKYFLPYCGVLKLWLLYFKNYKLCYLNYLPLWNFLIFFTLPPKTILGPITGTINKKRNFFLKKLFESLSIFIIKQRFKKCLFSNNFYYKFFPKHFHNYIIRKLEFKKISKKKYDFDFIFYYRKNYDQNCYQKKMISYLLSKNYKIALIGDKLKIKNILNFGYIRNNKLNKILCKTKCAVSNPENLYSFFVQDCLSNNLIVFYNNEFKKFEKFQIKNFYPIPYDNINNAYQLIVKNMTKPIKKNKNINLQFENFFKNV